MTTDTKAVARYIPTASHRRMVRVDGYEGGTYVSFADHEQVVAELTKAHQDNLDSWLHQREEIAFLRAELAAKSKDAERYRWLTDPDFGQISISDVFNAWWRSENGHPETINDAIDLAMKQDEEAIGEGNE